MNKINRFLEEKFLKQVSRDNYFVWKKANLLCEVNLLFLFALIFLIAPVHYLDFERHPQLVVGDVLVITGLIISTLFLRKGKVSLAGMCTVIAYIMIPFVHNFIGDWLFPDNVGFIRFFETCIMLCFLFMLIVTFSTNRPQIIVGAILSIPVILGHFFVLKNVVGVAIPYTYLLYALMPLTMGVIALINLRLVNDAIEIVTKSKDQVIEWNKKLEETVEQRTRELIESNNKLEAISNLDGLTGLFNRRYFDIVLSTEWNRAQRNESHMALMIGDVDWFKEFNDIYGHQAGDECLRLVAKVFQENAQRESDLVARFGGDEFVAIIPVVKEEQVISFAERLVQGVRDLNLPHSGSNFGNVTISIGIAVTIPKVKQKAEDLFRDADIALYLAKDKGRNQYVLWDNESDSTF